MKYTRKFRENQRQRQLEEQQIESYKIGKGVMNFFQQLYNEGVEEQQFDLNTSSVSSVHQIPNPYSQDKQETQLSDGQKVLTTIKLQYLNTEIGSKKYNPFSQRDKESTNENNQEVTLEKRSSYLVSPKSQRQDDKSTPRMEKSERDEISEPTQKR